MSTIKVDTIATRTGSGNITLSNSFADVTINRTGNGVSQTIQNSGTTVGQIGVNSTDNMYFVSTNTGFKLLKDEAAIAPAQSGGSNHDNALDLGVSGVRWKDLYLSGGLKIGGTGAANTLDDYEEGTWTPVITGTSSAGSGTYSAQTATYTKIGRLVTFTFALGWSNHTGSGGIEIGGFPFTPSAQSYYLTQLEGVSLTSNNFATFARIEASSNKGVMVQSPVAGGNRAVINMDTTGYVNGSGTFNTA